MGLPGLNLRGVTEFCRILLREPEILLPHLSVHELNEVPFQQLKDKGFHGVVFDKDNTLTTPHGKTLAPSVEKPLAECRRVFGDQNVVVFSNTAGSSEDKGFLLADQLEKELGLPVLRHNTKKPNGIQALTHHFQVDAQCLIMIGDRYATDVLFGNQNGLYTVRTSPLTTADESAMNLQMQKLEQAVVDRLRQSGTLVKPHPLVETPTMAADRK